MPPFNQGNMPPLDQGNMQHRPGSLFFVPPSMPNILRPSYLSALTKMLQLSFYDHLPAHLVAEEMQNLNYPPRVFTPYFIAGLIGTQGVSVPNPYYTNELMVQEAVGVLGTIIELYENSYKLDAVVQLAREKHHMVPKDLIASVIIHYQLYYERGFLGA